MVLAAIHQRSAVAAHGAAAAHAAAHRRELAMKVVIRDLSIRSRPKTHLRRCPGCGDRGDIDHIVACTTGRITEAQRRGAGWMLALVRKQVGRRGAVDLVALGRAAELVVIPPGRPYR